MMQNKTIYSFIAASAMVTVANAASVTVTNFDFSSPTLSEGGITVAAPTGWTQTTTSGTAPVVGTFNPNTASFYADTDVLDGSGTGGVIGTMSDRNAAFFFNNNAGIVALTQTTGTSVSGLAGDTISATIAVGTRDVGSQPFDGYRIDLLIGGNVVGTATSNTGPTSGTFADVTINYTTLGTDSGAIGIRLSNNNADAINDSSVDFDNVRIDHVAIPEPSSAALLGLGGLALILRRRK